MNIRGHIQYATNYVQNRCMPQLEGCVRILLDLTRRISAVFYRILIGPSSGRSGRYPVVFVLNNPVLKRELEQFGVSITPQLCRSFNSADPDLIGNFIEFIQRIRGDHPRCYTGAIDDWKYLLTRPQVRQHIKILCALMAKSPKFRDAILAAASEAVITCQDRIGLFYTQFVGLVYLHEKKTLKEKAQVILGIARGDRLEKEVEALGTGDPVEDKIWARLQAKERLGIPYVLTGMHHRGCVHITDAQIDEIVRKILDEEPILLVLTNSSLWIEEITRKHKAEIERVKREFDEQNPLPEDSVMGEGEYLRVVNMIQTRREEAVLQRIQEITGRFIASHPDLQRF